MDVEEAESSSRDVLTDEVACWEVNVVELEVEVELVASGPSDATRLCDIDVDGVGATRTSLAP